MQSTALIGWNAHNQQPHLLLLKLQMLNVAVGDKALY